MRALAKNAHRRDVAGPQLAAVARPSLLECLQHVPILLVIHVLYVSFELPVFDKDLNLISETPRMPGSITVLGAFLI